MTRMHPDETPTSAALVRRLLASQMPRWAYLPVAPLASSGTDNALFRLGEELLVRLPRIHWAAEDAAKDARWLPWLAPRLPLAVPEPLALGAPGEGYPYAWSVYRWLPGESARLERLADPASAARTLAGFLLALQALDTDGGPDAVRLGARAAPDGLERRDARTRACLDELAGELDLPAALAVWEAALAAEPWRGPPVWVHGDVMPGNVLLRDGRAHAVIDWASLSVGDPAPDLMVAWSLFAGESREAFLKAMGADDAMRARARGHALSQAAIFIPYYRHTNPEGVENARRLVATVLADGWG